MKIPHLAPINLWISGFPIAMGMVSVERPLYTGRSPPKFLGAQLGDSVSHDTNDIMKVWCFLSAFGSLLAVF